MQTSRQKRLGRLLTVAAALCGAGAAQSQVFTYQGKLEQSGVPFEGTAGMQVRMFDAATGGSLLGTQGLSAQVDHGIFTVLLNTGGEFGPQAFLGDERWLEFVVDGQVLSPRQILTPTPFAVTASNLKGRIEQGNATGYFAANSQGALEEFLYPRWYDDVTYMTIGGQGLEVRTPFPQYATRMHITPAGYVGIGTNSPSSEMQVAGTLTTDGLRIPTGAAAGRVLVSDASGNAAWQAAPSNQWNSNGSNIYFNGGTVGIGTTSPTWPLHVIPDATHRGIRVGGVATGAASVSIGTHGADGLPYIQGVEAEGTNWGTLSLNPYGGMVRVRMLNITGGSDIAEPYDVSTPPNASAQPGMVVSIDPDAIGKLRLSTSAYDHTVAGVISGANGVNPGMVLTQKESVADGTHPVAMTGRVWCWCDADAGGAIAAGDLLTTSDTAGHAMKSTDALRAGGAVIGKAMSRLERGKGLVLARFNLQ